MIDAADVGPADGRSLHAQQHFAVARLGHGNLTQFRRCCCPANMRPASCFRSLHPRSQRSSQLWSSFHRNTWPLISRHFRSMPAIACHFRVAQRLARGRPQVRHDSCSAWSKRESGVWPRCTAHFTQTSRRMHAQPSGDLHDHRILHVHRVFRRAVALPAAPASPCGQ